MTNDQLQKLEQAITLIQSVASELDPFLSNELIDSSKNIEEFVKRYIKSREAAEAELESLPEDHLRFLKQLPEDIRRKLKMIELRAETGDWKKINKDARGHPVRGLVDRINFFNVISLYPEDRLSLISDFNATIKLLIDHELLTREEAERHIKSLISKK